MEAMGSLVAGVAHEVRNPLFSISATVDAIEAALGQHPQFAEHAAMLRAQLGRLTQLTRDLLDYGRPSLLQAAPTDLASVVRRAALACATLRQQRRIDLEEQLAPELGPLDLDGARLEQVFENLLANAMQLSPLGSRVRVTSELATLDGRPFVRCAVEDQGPGLARDDLPHVFEPFFSRRTGGTGLGLAIVRRVVEAHGGKVAAENRAGGGACFTLWLPARAARPGDA